MKNLLLIALVLFMSFGAVAQNDELELFKTAFKVEKKALLMDFLTLGEAESKTFWPTYDAYQLELSKTSSKRVALITEYAEEYENMSNEQADALVAKSFKIRAEREKLQKSYYKKFKKNHGAKRAAQFVQFERFVQIAIDAELNNSFPLVGERI